MSTDGGGTKGPYPAPVDLPSPLTVLVRDEPKWYIGYSKEVGKMAGIKDQVIKIIESLPEDITLDDVMAELYFKLQVDAGLKELDEGKGIPHEEVERRMSRWLTK